MVYWMWNIFQNVHGCRRKVLEKSSNAKVTEEVVRCIRSNGDDHGDGRFQYWLTQFVMKFSALN